MKDKTTVRYLGYRTLLDGGRGFDFSVTSSSEEDNVVSIDVGVDLFRGPDRIAIQEGAGICYEALKSRVDADSTVMCQAFSLNHTDVEQHRKTLRPAGRRH